MERIDTILRPPATAQMQAVTTGRPPTSPTDPGSVAPKSDPASDPTAGSLPVTPPGSTSELSNPPGISRLDPSLTADAPPSALSARSNSSTVLSTAPEPAPAHVNASDLLLDKAWNESSTPLQAAHPTHDDVQFRTAVSNQLGADADNNLSADWRAHYEQARASTVDVEHMQFVESADSVQSTPSTPQHDPTNNSGNQSQGGTQSKTSFVSMVQERDALQKQVNALMQQNANLTLEAARLLAEKHLGTALADAGVRADLFDLPQSHWAAINNHMPEMDAGAAGFHEMGAALVQTARDTGATGDHDSPGHMARNLAIAAQLTAATMDAQRAAMLMQALAASSQPLVALVWTDIFRLQQARLDQLAASRAVDENGEPAPADSDEAIMRQRRIQGVDLPSLAGRHAHEVEALAEGEEAKTMDAWFRAALVATALMRPQVVTRMFRSGDAHPTVRFFRKDKAARFLEEWHRLSADTLPTSVLAPKSKHAALARVSSDTVRVRDDVCNWVQVAEQTYLQLSHMSRLPQHEPNPGRSTLTPSESMHGPLRAERALEMIHGRSARTITVGEGLAQSARIWAQVVRTNAPYDDPMVATTRSDAPDGLRPSHPYAVIGAFPKGRDWMVALCNPAGSDAFSDEYGVFAVTFDVFKRNTTALTSLQRRPT